MTKDVRRAITIIAQHLALIDWIFEDGGYTDKDRAEYRAYENITAPFAPPSQYLENVLKEHEL